MASGATELAPMSTTTDPSVAISYAISEESLIFKLKVDNVVQYTAPTCSGSRPCSPETRRSCTYPPPIYLQPTGREDELTGPNGEKYTRSEQGGRETKLCRIEITPNISSGARGTDAL